MTELAPAELFLKCTISRTEASLEEQFLTSNATLGGAAARSMTDLSLTGSKKSESKLITSRQETVYIPLDNVSCKPTNATSCVFQRYGMPSGDRKDCPVTQISGRARLNITASRTGAAINGTITGTMSGQGSVLLHELLKTGSGTSPYVQVPAKYAGWADYSAVFSIHNAQIVSKTRDDKYEEEDVVILHDHTLNKMLNKVDPILKRIYDDSWELREQIVYPKSPFLTKAIAVVPVGQNGGPYELASLVNDVQSTFSIAQIEAILAQCVALELGFDAESPEFMEMKKNLAAGPHLESAIEYAELLATSVSTFQSYTKPYRVDGTPVVLPTGTQMITTESWLLEPARDIFSADDCDGSAASAIATVRTCVEARHEWKENQTEALSPYKIPHVHMIANSLGAFFVYGTSVLGANAGHAEAADTEAQTIAGHAVAILIPKAHVLTALEDAGKGILPTTGKPVIDPEHRDEVAAQRFASLFPPDLRSEIAQMIGENGEDYYAFDDWESLKQSDRMMNRTKNGFQFLAMEGTTPACARTYEHDSKRRMERVREAELDKKVTERLAPNISRSFKSLDSVTPDGDHGFYSDFVEMSVSIRSPLFTNKKLQALGYATPHFVLTQRVQPGTPITVAGSTPKQIAECAYGLVPLWRVEREFGAILETSSRESLSNRVPFRDAPQPLTEREAHNLAFSISNLKMLKTQFDGAVIGRNTHHNVHQVFSFAALVRNPQAVAAFCRTIRSIQNAGGALQCNVVDGIASYPSKNVAMKCVERQNTIFDVVAPNAKSDDASMEEIDLNSAGRFCVLSLQIPV